MKAIIGEDGNGLNMIKNKFNLVKIKFNNQTRCLEMLGKVQDLENAKMVV